MAKFEKGQRYSAGGTADGTVCEVLPNGKAMIEWDEKYRGVTGEWDPWEIGRHLISLPAAISQKTTQRPYDQVLDTASSLVQQAMAKPDGLEAEYNELRRHLGVVSRSGETAGETLRRILDERAGACGAAGASQRYGDVAAERDRLKQRVSELETDVAFWKREAVRLKGGRR